MKVWEASGWARSASGSGIIVSRKAKGTMGMNITVQEILQQAVADDDVSDIFLVAGLPATLKSGGRQKKLGNEALMPDRIRELVDEIYREAGRERTRLEGGEDDDFSLSMRRRENFPGGRFRVNVFRQRGSLAAVIRVIRFELPDPVKLGIPEDVLSLVDNKDAVSSRTTNRGGLVLVTGAAGTGKSTTLACMVDRVNRTRDCHIITMEDPIEYVHRHKEAIVSQREISIDTPSYTEALRSALRESPDVILLGEMRDYSTISAALTAAETGVLVLSTLHTSSAADTVSRIVDAFPDKGHARVQLAQVLRAVVCQQLVPSTHLDEDGDEIRIPVFEIMKSTEAIQNMIRENKANQLSAAIQSGSALGMCTMDGSLLNLYREKKIAKETALKYRIHYGYEYMKKRLEG